jgi:hypothetical protein
VGLAAPDGQRRVLLQRVRHAGVRDGLDCWTWYLESIYKFLPGWYVAGRYDVMRYSDVQSSAGTVTWDQDTQRTEAGVGYHVTPALIVKGVAQVWERGDGWEWKSVLPGVQVSFRY